MSVSYLPKQKLRVCLHDACTQKQNLSKLNKLPINNGSVSSRGKGPCLQAHVVTRVSHTPFTNHLEHSDQMMHPLITYGNVRCNKNSNWVQTCQAHLHRHTRSSLHHPLLGRCLDMRTHQDDGRHNTCRLWMTRSRGTAWAVC